MKRILFDNNVPSQLVTFLRSQYTCTEARDRGWALLENGTLLCEAELAGFNILVTADKKMPFQQNLANRTIAVVVLGAPEWPRIEAYIERVIAAIESATPGNFLKVDIPWN